MSWPVAEETLEALGAEIAAAADAGVSASTAHGDLTPGEYATKWTTTNPPKAA